MKKDPMDDKKKKFKSPFFKKKTKETTPPPDDIKAPDADIQNTDNKETASSVQEAPAAESAAFEPSADEISPVVSSAPEPAAAETTPVESSSAASSGNESLSAEHKNADNAESVKKPSSFIGSFFKKIKSYYVGPEQADENNEIENGSISEIESQENAAPAAAVKSKNKKILIGIAAAVFVAASVIIIILVSGSGTPDGMAYVRPVSELNTAVKSISGNRFSGVVESQKTYDIKLESDKSIKDIYVNDGDSVEEGDELFSYDVEAMELELENGELEIESLENEIDSTKRQISELEDEKEKAGKENQLSYTTQIQSLKTDIEKIEYDIKVKNAAQEKLKAAIENAAMTAPFSGTVKSLKTVEQMQEEGTDVIMNIVADGNFRIKGKINEQNIGAVIEGDAVVIRSRVDDNATWKGTVTEISNEPESNNNMMYGMDDSENTSSNYAFYITPESIEGLMLGQHVLIEPDTGLNSGIEKDGIWLYEDYIVDLGTDEPYVWAVDDHGRLEKRIIETGQTDEDNGDIEITSGLDNDDLIAYPSDDYEEGMKTSNKEEEELDTELNGDGENDMDFMPDDGNFDEDMNFDDMDFGDMNDDMDFGNIDFGDIDLDDTDLDDIDIEDSEVEQ